MYNNTTDDNISTLSPLTKRIEKLNENMKAIFANSTTNNDFELEKIYFERELVRLESHIIRYFAMYRISNIASFRILKELVAAFMNINRNSTSNADKVKTIENIMVNMRLIGGCNR